MAQRQLREKADSEVLDALNKQRTAEQERQRALALSHQADERALSEAKAKTKADQSKVSAHPTHFDKDAAMVMLRVSFSVP